MPLFLLSMLVRRKKLVPFRAASRSEMVSACFHPRLGLTTCIVYSTVYNGDGGSEFCSKVQVDLHAT